MTEPPRPPENPLAALGELATQAAERGPRDPVTEGATYGLTDYDNARRIALYEGEDHHYCAETDVWWRWDGVRWCVAPKGDVLAASARALINIATEAPLIGGDDEQRQRHLTWATSSLSARSINAALGLATALPKVRVRDEQLDSQAEIMTLANCTLNVRTGQWWEPRREDLITRLCPTPWHGDVASPLLDAFLQRFLPDLEERNYVLDCLAVSALSYGNPGRKLLLVIGPTSTGKSTLTDLLKATLGQDHVASVNPSVFRGSLDDRPRPDLLRALRSRLVLAFEANESWELHADQIKRMTGGDPLTARAMRSDTMVEKIAPFTPVIVANEPPRIKGADDALRTRLMCVLMDAPSVENDDGKARAALVGDDLARQALLAELLRRYRERDGVMPAHTELPQRFAEFTQAVFTQLDDVDTVLQQLKDDGTLLYAPQWQASHCVKISELYRCYQHLVKKGTQVEQREMLGSKQFAQRLRSLGYEVVRSDGMRVNGWTLGNTMTAIQAKI